MKVSTRAGILGAAQRRLAGVVMTGLALGLALLLPGHLPVAAKGDDVCPEANDTFQAACFLGVDSDALGFIAQATDVDAYRFEVRDYGATVRVSLPDRPLPYRLNLANWNGDVIASGPDGNLQARLDLPGSYYVFVDSGTGAFSDTAPYRIVYGVTYASQPVPEVLFTSEFRGGPRDIFGDTGTNSFSDEVGVYTIDKGRITIKMTAPGTNDEPVSAMFYQSPDPPDPGPTVEDFTMSIDARVEGTDQAGYAVLFRYIDGDNYYQAEVNLMDKMVALTKLVDGELLDVTDWVDAPSLNTAGVNRTVIRAVGEEIRVNINGKEVIRATDSSFQRGLVGYGAVAYGDPPTVNFDNILVTTPTRR
ncbi:MAG: hypothetical protein AB7P40_10295 [Chloroflexota bacterium]